MRIKEVITEKENLLDVYNTLKEIERTKQGLDNFTSLVGNKRKIEDDLFKMGGVEAKINEKNTGHKKACEYTDALEEASKTVKNKFINLMDEWIENVQKENHSEKNFEVVDESIERDKEFEVMEKAKRYKKKLTKLWSTYEIIKDRKNEEKIGSVEMLDQDLDEILNKLNDEIYNDSEKAYT